MGKILHASVEISKIKSQHTHVCSELIYILPDLEYHHCQGNTGQHCFPRRAGIIVSKMVQPELVNIELYLPMRYTSADYRLNKEQKTY